MEIVPNSVARRPQRRAMPNHGRHWAIAAALAILLASPHAFAADGQPIADEARRKLELQRNELEATRERQKFLQSDIAEIKKERERLNANLLETAGQIQASEARLNALEAKIGRLGEDETALRADLAANHGKITKLMAALQRMGRNPPPVLYTQRQDALQMVRSAMLLAYAFPELKGDAKTVSVKLSNLINILDGIRAEREEARAEQARLSDSRVRLSALIETKKQAVSARQAESEKMRARVAELSKSVTDLNV
ncbi:MAG: murein hydrolase activator EnvC family protein, partial [Gammaproteobacteria bacterium]